LSETLASSELSSEEVRALREFIAKKVLESVNGAFGMVVAPRTALAEKPYPSWAIAHIIGNTSGVLRLTFTDPNGKWVNGVTLVYWLLEAKRAAEGLRVSVAVEPEKKEGVMFTVEGVIKTNG